MSEIQVAGAGGAFTFGAMTKRAEVLGLLGWCGLSLAVMLFAALFQPGEWYAALAKPAWTPPNWLFGPVWLCLYVMMAVAAWLVWRRRGFAGARAALGCYLFQLALNAAWSWIFFGEHRMGVGFANLAVLWAAIVATAGLFGKHNRVAALLLVPYLLWVTYATALNFAVWRLNS